MIWQVWLTTDIERLSEIINGACDEMECVECPFKKYTECPGDTLGAVIISIQTLTRTFEKCVNMLKEQI